MKPLSEEEVGRIADLARLSLSAAECQRLATELTAILSHMDALASVDTAGVEPMTHAVPLSLRLRDDEPRPSLPVSTAIAAAPDSDEDQFRVPPVLVGGADS